MYTFNLKDSPWSLDEFDERIVKALYLWQPSLDEKMKANFEYFASLVEDEPMSKENILATVQSHESNEWDAVSSFV